jgi:hypothetical protein
MHEGHCCYIIILIINENVNMHEGHFYHIIILISFKFKFYEI